MLKWEENRTSFRFLLEKSQQSCLKILLAKKLWGGGYNEFKVESRRYL